MSRIAVIGLGPIGLTAARAVQLDPHQHLHALIDTDASLVGTEPLIDGPVVQDSDASLADCDVALICTGSSFADLEPVLRRCIETNTHVVSSCEEMLWPAYRHGLLAEAMDNAAIEAGVSLLGTGVNPGFVMDYLPLVASAAVPEVTRVRVLRRVDAGGRRKPLQAKVGATLSVEQFEERRAAGTIGHRGMAESVAMVCAGLGHAVKPGSIEETLDPVVADRELHSALGTIEPGQVAGMRNVGRWRGEGLQVELDLIMSVGWQEPVDIIELGGPTPLRVKVSGGTPGDSATAAVLANCARVLPRSRPGLRTMLDLGHVPASRAMMILER